MRRPTANYVYGALDLLLAALYAYVLLALTPSRSGVITAVALGLCGVLAAGGLGMMVWGRWGRRLAVASSVLMLLACLTLITLLAASAAYLHGIYDGIGQAGVAISLLVILLSVELVGLLPALQLAHIRRLNRGAGEGGAGS